MLSFLKLPPGLTSGKSLLPEMDWDDLSDPAHMVDLLSPLIIEDVAEAERKTTLQQRTLLLRSLGIVDIVHRYFPFLVFLTYVFSTVKRVISLKVSSQFFR